MSWMFLRDLLSGVNKYSTGIGRIWLAVVFIFRLLVYIVAAEHVWKDEDKAFECNTRQPGCENVCFDYFFPISQVRLWALQLIMVSTPSLLVVLHVAYRQSREKRHRKKLYVSPGTMDGGLCYTYLLSLIVKTGFEIGFLVLFCKLYGSFSVSHIMKCDLKPCPNTVDCFVSKPTEKTIFIFFLVIASCLCIVLNVTELSFLVLKYFFKCSLHKHSKKLKCSEHKSHHPSYVECGEVGAPP
ncbi:gap junction beta-7 protein [Perognathus longimembris pacificus]|uniref:gap junction beta-7 protein n=1 Tax=Perognathus longimembris pacificus TaxID=214514 RepID=UPI002018FF94|nr:gap junction beta-7 protein [Perognathus longimembris pacificus]XP_048209825.1 gap junction beta-7 protein [Perognathus longimembris pacificus]XP_048209826.1 gap junction beta-7 protein [Perognathus longimembris pacificus]XP_048209827.1 gap junction beta-7 protein [Perognathus longimembris pacificus]